MTRIATITLIIAIGFVAFYSCKPKRNEPAPAPVYSMHAIINGAAFNGNICIVGRDTGGWLEIKAWNTTMTYPMVEINLYNYAGVGTYTISDSLTSNTITVDSGIFAFHFASSGTVNITSLLPAISGTFNAEFYPTSITNGTFTAKK